MGAMISINGNAVPVWMVKAGLAPLTKGNGLAMATGKGLAKMARASPVSFVKYDVRNGPFRIGPYR